MSILFDWFWRLLPANPLVVRIVQNGSRRTRHLWARMGYLGLLIAILLSTLLAGQGMGQSVSLTDLAKAGTQVFQIVAYGQVILVCLLAPLFMAGAIAAEQSGKTMDILLTTPLSNLQIVLGSLVGRLFFVLALLFSGLPLFSILLFFGGVPPEAIFSAFTVAAMTALTVGSVAVTLAVLRKGGRKAVFLFVIAVAGYLALTWGVDRLARYNQSLAGVPSAWLGQANASTSSSSSSNSSNPSAGPAFGSGRTTLLTPLHPMLVLEASTNSANYRLPAPDELANLPAPLRVYLGRPLTTFSLLSLGLSAVLMLFSAIQLREAGQELPLRTRLLRWLSKGRAGQQRERTARSVGTNPVAWREWHTRGSNLGSRISRGLFLLLGIAAAVTLLICYHYSFLPQMNDPFGGGPLSQMRVFHYVLSTLLLVEVTAIVLVALYMSAGCVSKEREDGTLDLILTTPISPRNYLWGKLRGLVGFLSHLLVVPVVTVLLVSIYVTVGTELNWQQTTATFTLPNGGGTARMPLMPPEVALWVPLLLVPFVSMCVMVGMTWSLKSRGVLGSIVPSVGIIGAVTLVTGFCGYTMAQEVPWLGPAFNAFSPATNLLMLINPYERVAGYLESPTAGRISLAVASMIACAGYGMIVYTMLTAMVRTFDQTIRKLSGTG
jgi:ABC-type transport system involved in multi-copper enzyme maturation permease subunit